MLKVSVIMPVYNTGDYLAECLETIKKQTLSSYELICVDDYSTDQNTLEILDEYEKELPWMMVLKNKYEKGAAGARNTGFEYAKGKYIIFLDSDDLLNPVMLQKMYEEAEHKNAELVTCNYLKFEERDGLYQFLPSDARYMLTYGQVARYRDLGEYKPQEFMPLSPWTKLCKRQFLIDNGIHFQDLTSSNDVFYSSAAIIMADRACITDDEPLLYHRVNTKTQISANRDSRNVYRAVSYLIDYVKEKKLLDDLMLRRLLCMMMDGTTFDFNRTSDELAKQEAYLLIQEYLKENAMGITFERPENQGAYDRYLNMTFESRWFEP